MEMVETDADRCLIGDMDLGVSLGAFMLWYSLVERLEARLISSRSIAIAKCGLPTSVTILFSGHRWRRKRTSRRRWSHW
jgi:hypothetical protein